MNEDSAVEKVEVASAQLIKFFSKRKMSLKSGMTEVMLTRKKLAKQEVGQTKAKMRRRLLSKHIGKDPWT